MLYKSNQFNNGGDYYLQNEQQTEKPKSSSHLFRHPSVRTVIQKLIHTPIHMDLPSFNPPVFSPTKSYPHITPYNPPITPLNLPNNPHSSSSNVPCLSLHDNQKPITINNPDGKVVKIKCEPNIEEDYGKNTTINNVNNNSNENNNHNNNNNNNNLITNIKVCTNSNTTHNMPNDVKDDVSIEHKRRGDMFSLYKRFIVGNVSRLFIVFWSYL